jgi:hypothetical protein
MTTTVYALIEFKHTDGNTYEPGDPAELPDETDADKAELAKLLDYGMVTKSASRGQKVAEKAAEPGDSPQRTSRRRS